MSSVSSERIDITPDTSIMEDIGSASYTVYQALNELLANTFDARIYTNYRNSRDGMPIRVDITIKPGVSIQVEDNASGMGKDTLSKALVLSYKMDREFGNRSRKGMYGLGMKTAAASLGRKWELWTRSTEEEKDYYVCVDLVDFKARWKDKDKWMLELTTLDRDTKSPLGKRSSGTVIRITDVRDRHPDIEEPPALSVREIGKVSVSPIGP